eukprot:CAMPEP_0169174322 /NCGR_PEP_ID=MMETSP1015-20121227/64459_1 /TAXON_ID=342587 /ORGANISM="Karlodinium micrum, Strain CCMP2283" /LENGTH=105 /DNA_ID=CAMNT_0009248123 /DNA_START=42 /DNA_END=356 /DNA_ORIENTATION=+
MAENYQQIRRLKLAQTCWTMWYKDVQRAKTNKEKKAVQQKHDHEITTLKNKHREKGDQTANLMADKFQRKLLEAQGVKCLNAWLHKAHHDVAERKQKDLASNYEK